MGVDFQALCCGFESRVDFFFTIFLTYFFSTSRVRVRVRILVGVILSLKKIHGQVLVTRCSSGSEIALTVHGGAWGGFENRSSKPPQAPPRARYFRKKSIIRFACLSEYQIKALSNLLRGKDCFIPQPTGSGKSAVYISYFLSLMI